MLYKNLTVEMLINAQNVITGHRITKVDQYPKRTMSIDGKNSRKVADLMLVPVLRLL